jgi:predicted aldo/keto reductase-like oxidoreductase
MKPFGGGAVTNTATALKFLLADRNVNVVVPGMMTVQEVEENVAVAKGSYRLTAEDRRIIEKDRKELAGEYCRGCNYCQPCPQKIPISFVLRAETQFLRRFGFYSDLQDELRTAEELVPTCRKCGECESRCPYHLQIRELLPLKLDSLKKRIQTKNF